MAKYRTRRAISGLAIMAAIAVWLAVTPDSYERTLVLSNNSSQNSNNSSQTLTNSSQTTNSSAPLATTVLEKLSIKGRAPKTGYSREEFYSTWPTVDGCSLRQRIIKRELGDTAVLGDDNCTVISGEYDEPYTGSHLIFYQKSDFTTGVHIDHVVALSDAWQKGAQNLTKDERYSLATDPLNLLAVDATTNQNKSDGDAASWLPPNKSFRCEYIARQISVKYKYSLWLTQAEHDTMSQVLSTCPDQPAVGISL